MGPYGVPGSATYSQPVMVIDNMLVRLPDNSGNQIDAKDVRDVVSGLYDLIEIQAASVSAIGAISTSFTNLNPSTVLVGGLATQSSFNNIPFEDVFNLMLYPYTPPILAATPSSYFLEYGSSPVISFNWNINSTKNGITIAVVISGVTPPVSVAPPLPPFTSISGTRLVTIVQDVITTVTLRVDDTDYTTPFPYTGGVHDFNVTVGWRNKRYWGTLPSSSPLVSVSSATFSFSFINTLSSDLLLGYTQSRNITTNNDYVVFMWPTDSSVDLSAMPPIVSINGIPNNDWIKTRDNVEFINQWGYTASYDVWCFNSTQPNYQMRYVLS